MDEKQKRRYSQAISDSAVTALKNHRTDTTNDRILNALHLLLAEQRETNELLREIAGQEGGGERIRIK